MFTENMSAFFNTDEFAVTLTYTPSGGSVAVSVPVVFDSPTQDVLGGDVLTNEYAITFPTGACPGLKSGVTATVSGVSYKVREVRMQDDGALSVAKLSKV